MDLSINPGSSPGAKTRARQLPREPNPLGYLRGNDRTITWRARESVGRVGAFFIRQLAQRRSAPAAEGKAFPARTLGGRDKSKLNAT
jgi:hypothetical protein